MPSSDPTEGIGGPDHFAAVLNKLFRMRLKTTEDGRTKPYTLREVAQGTGISIGYLSEARHGNIENPSLDKLLLLARFFDVSPTIFLEPLPQGEGSPAVTRTESGISSKEQAVRHIAFRAEGFSEVELAMVREVMDTIERHRPRESDVGTDGDARDRRHSPPESDATSPGR